MNESIKIRPAKEIDWEEIWPILKAVIESGGAYVFYPDSTEERMKRYWFDPDKKVYVAHIGSALVGSFVLKDNFDDLSSHIANASYMTAPSARGKGVGYAMGAFSLEEAKRLGYQAMQFNIVIKSNESAVRLWRKLGFSVVGEIPEAYQHPTEGLVNAYIMYQKL